MKKWMLPLLCLYLCLPTLCLGEDYLVSETAATAGGGIATVATGVENEKLRDALLQLADGSVLDAINSLTSLGKTDGADRYAAYANAQLALMREDPATAEAALTGCDDCLDSAYQLALIQATRLHRFAQNGLFGFVDQTGAWKIAPQFDWAERVFRSGSETAHDPLAAEYTPEELYRVAAVFSGVTDVSETDTEPVEGKYGLLRSDGTLVAPVKYTAVLWAKDGVAAMEDGEKTQLYRITTAEPVGEAYDEAGAYAEGYVPVKKGDKWAYLNPLTGEVLGEGFVWETALPFSQELAAVSRDGLYGYIGTDGQAAIALQYAGAASFSEGLAGVRVGNRWGFIDSKGTLAIQPAYAGVKGFQQGQCAVRKGEQWGLINTSGEVTLRLKYSEIEDFDPIYHRAWFRQNKLWGLVSSGGNVVMKPTWGAHDAFSGNTLCRVAYRDAYAFVDANGKTRVSGEFSAASPFRANYAGVRDASGGVRYLSKTLQSFTVPTTVPVECLCGFIEGRTIAETVTETADTLGNPVTVTERTIAYALFDATGNPITVAAYGDAQG